ncbi:hypothetical protein [Ferruginivarius sediminum]|nr:hypothetical protein [Ferruginivarius sediminum]
MVAPRTVQQEVADAKVAALAEICERRAYHHWTVDEDRPVAKLDGWDNERRGDLAQQFVPAGIEQDGLRQPVQQACDKALRPARAGPLPHLAMDSRERQTGAERC